MFDQIKTRVRDALVARVTFETAWPFSKRHVYLEPESAATPECLALPLAPEARHLQASRYESPAAWWALAEGALYYTDAIPNDVVLARRGRIVAESDNIHLEHPGVHPAWTYAWKGMYLRPASRIRGRCIVLRSPANNYYHTLVDNLPRLLALHDPALSKAEIRIIVPGPLSSYEAWFLDRLLPPSAKLAQVAANALYRPDELVFASYASRQMCGFLPQRFVEFLNAHVRPQRRSHRNRRLYISRAARTWRHETKGRRIKNEESVVRLLEKYGFEPVIFEQLPLEAQISAMHDAVAVVSPHGAGLTNLLFCDDVDVVELHPCRTMLPHYYFLSKARGHRYWFLCSNEQDRNDNFDVDLSALQEILSGIS